jgi:poly(A) polymerase
MAETSSAPPVLKDASWLRWPETGRVFAALSGDNAETRAVGGAVRDALLGRDVTDVDFATTAVPDKVMARARRAGLKAIPTGIEHGTVTVIADGRSFEVTTLRRDVETFGRRAKVAFTKDWAEDAARRDFTLNAFYASADGTVHDPLGGYRDLVEGRVRFIGDAEARIREDYLRILRFFRFNAYYGTGPLDEDGRLACIRQRAGLTHLSAERIAAELKRLLTAPRAQEAVVELFKNGLLTDILASVPRLQRFDRLIAIERAVDAEVDPIARVAALAVFVPEDASRLAARFKLSNAEQARLALGADETLDAALPDEAAAKRLLYALGPETYPRAVLLAWAARAAVPEDAVWRDAYNLSCRWEVPVFPLRGPDITALGVFKGPAIGEMLRAVEHAWIEGGFVEDRNQLLERAKRLAMP